ncbi:MAG: glycoside hydrolase [Actinobacteria bacterium]|nr:glycoside hydrolase [Actinomycetota bacterium]
MSPTASRNLRRLAIGLACAGTLAVVSGACAVSGPLQTNGSRIVNAAGNEVVLQGVNWFGLETANHAPHGLWTRDYRDMLAQIKAQGFNVIRLPFSLQALKSATTSGIDYSGGRNAALQGKTPLQVMDEIIAEAGRQGLGIILDNHSGADDSFMSPLWYGTGEFTEDDWVATWEMLAGRYASNRTVLGADLKNEPHGEATWGTGEPNDWRRAAERAGNAVLAKAPSWLIVVEGIEGPVAGGQQLDRHWWGGNLEGVRNNPVRLSVPNRVVYSPHEYGPGVFAQPWFSSPDMANILADRWQKGFGYIHESGTAPILVGEFGAKNVSTDTVEGRWIRQFADYMSRTGMSWTFWAWNPNSGDTGGVLQDDWQTVNPAKMALLTSLINREAINYAPGTPTASPTPTPTPVPGTVPVPGTPFAPAPTPTPVPGTGPVPGTPTVRVAVDSRWAGGWCGKFVVPNTGSTVITPTAIAFTLPTGASVTSTWNGTVSGTGTSRSIALPSWARVPAGGGYQDTGLCVQGSGSLSAVTVSIAGAPAPTATPVPGTGPVPGTPSTTPTPAPAPAPALTPAPVTGSLAVSVTRDSTWETGLCRSFTVRNTGTTQVSGWRLAFTLPSGTSIRDSWNGTAGRQTGAVTVTPPTWAASIAPGASVNAFGFCANGTGEPTAVAASPAA